MSIELQHNDIIRLILQFLKESNLLSSYQTLQSESHISLNVLDSPSEFSKDVINGKWDSVLKQLTTLSLPSSKLMLLYEQLVYELLELSEKEAVLKILTETLINNGLRQQFPERCLTLDYLAKRSSFDAKSAYKQGSKEKNRVFLANQLSEEIRTAQPSRLLVLLGQALKYQEAQGLVQTGQVFDVFGNRKVKTAIEEAKLPLCVEKTIKLKNETQIESFAFSGNSEFLAVGCRDGIIEIWEPLTGNLKKDLAYQSEELYMLHTDPVISLGFSKDAELLASGDNKGIAKLWRVRNGKNLRKIDDNFGKPITFIGFGRDVSHLVMAEKSIRFFGLKSGRIIKEFAGHTSSVNDMLVSADGTRIASASNDSRLRIWDYASCECLQILNLNTELTGKISL
jgi:WD40 repeat-containing protein SMU1